MVDGAEEPATFDSDLLAGLCECHQLLFRGCKWKIFEGPGFWALPSPSKWYVGAESKLVDAVAEFGWELPKRRVVVVAAQLRRQVCEG